jgi:hypothetical protein
MLQEVRKTAKVSGQPDETEKNGEGETGYGKKCFGGN